MKIVDPVGLALFGLGFAVVCIGLVVMYGGLATLLGWGESTVLHNAAQAKPELAAIYSTLTTGPAQPSESKPAHKP